MLDTMSLDLQEAEAIATTRQNIIDEQNLKLKDFEYLKVKNKELNKEIDEVAHDYQKLFDDYSEMTLVLNKYEKMSFIDLIKLFIKRMF